MYLLKYIEMASTKKISKQIREYVIHDKRIIIQFVNTTNSNLSAHHAF